MSDEIRYTRAQDATPIQEALRNSMGGVMRQIRRYSAMSVALDVLPPEVAGQVAPYDVRLAPPLEPITAPAGPAAEAGRPGPVLSLAEVNTMFLYVTSATVQLVLEQRKRELINGINSRLPYPFVEELRFEQANAQKITRQLNILGTSPD
jgi:hypothetical protein